MTTTSPQSHKARLERFEHAWESGSEPELREFLPADELTLRADVFWDLVLLDLERRWRSGDDANAARPVLDDYLDEFSDRVSGPPPLDVVIREREVRRTCGDSAEVSEYVRRYGTAYPELVDVLTASESMMAIRDQPDVAHEATVIGSTGDTTGPVPNSEIAGLLAGLSSDSSPTNATIGRYRILSKLGKGGMGWVLLAEDSVLQHRVALKVPIAEDASEAVLQRVLREARVMAAVKHPHICHVYDVAETAGIPHIAMEYVDGSTLAEKLKDGWKPSLEEAVAVVRDTAAAVEALHERSIVHRDLKPGNVMIDRSGRAVLMDFGLAKRLENADDDLSRAGDVVGTLAYMPPEQLAGRGSEIGPQADVYSLGVMLYELLTGTRPHAGDLLEIVEKIAHADPPSMRQIDPSIPEPLEDVCRRAMHKAAHERFATAGEFAAALATVDLQPTTDSPTQTPTATSAIDRPRWWLAVSTIGVVAAMAILATMWQPATEPDASDGAVVTDAARDDDASAETTRQQSIAGPPDALRRPSLEIHFQRASQKSGFGVLATNAVPLRDNDKVQLHLSLDRPAYAYVYWYDAEGNPTRLWPKDVEDQTAVAEIWDPPLAAEGEKQEWYVVGDDLGLEVAVVAVSRKPIGEEALRSLETTRLDIGRVDVGGDGNDPHLRALYDTQERGIVGTVRSEKDGPPSKSVAILVVPSRADRSLTAIHRGWRKPRTERALVGVIASTKKEKRRYVAFEDTLSQHFDNWAGLVFPHE